MLLPSFDQNVAGLRACINLISKLTLGLTMVEHLPWICKHCLPALGGLGNADSSHPALPNQSLRVWGPQVKGTPLTAQHLALFSTLGSITPSQERHQSDAPWDGFGNCNLENPLIILKVALSFFLCRLSSKS